MKKYLETLHNYFDELYKIEDPDKIYTYWKNAPVLSNKELQTWIDEEYIEKSNYELTIQYQDQFGSYDEIRPNCFRIKTKVVTKKQYSYEEERSKRASRMSPPTVNFRQPQANENKLTEEEKKKILEEIEAEFESLIMKDTDSFTASKYYIDDRDELKIFFHDFKTIEKILKGTIHFKIIFFVDNNKYKKYFEDVIKFGYIGTECNSQEHYSIEESTYKKGLTKIELKIIGVHEDVFKWIFSFFSDVIYYSNYGGYIKEYFEH